MDVPPRDEGSMGGDRVPRGEDRMECTYCHKPMIEVVLGWHCPECHASIGESPVSLQEEAH